MKKIGLLVLVVLINLFVISCGKSHQLIGTWIGPNKDTIEFFDNNTANISGVYNGNWVILKDGRVKLDFQGVSLLGDLKGNNLVFDSSGMGGYSYKKVK